MQSLIDSFVDKVNLNADFNPKIRDDFVMEVASQLPVLTQVLDVSSGTKPYAEFFAHCIYTSHEFEGNKNIIDDFRFENSIKKHDIYSEIDNIPVNDDAYDFILCTEVFEHIPEPIKAMKELVRICKPGGKILITAPFSSGVHQEPYHYYSGFSPYFYDYLKNAFNLNIIKFKSQGNIFLLGNQEMKRVLQFIHPLIQKNQELMEEYEKIIKFLNAYTLSMSDLCEHELKKIDNSENMLSFYNIFNKFTIGYCVLFQKPKENSGSHI